MPTSDLRAAREKLEAAIAEYAGQCEPGRLVDEYVLVAHTVSIDPDGVGQLHVARSNVAAYRSKGLLNEGIELLLDECSCEDD